MGGIFAGWNFRGWNFRGWNFPGTRSTGYLDGRCEISREVPLMPQPHGHFLDRERRADYTPFAGIEQLCMNTSEHVGGGEERRSMLQMWWPVRGWSTPTEWDGKSPHLHPAPPKGGPNPPYFRRPAENTAGSSAASQWGRGAKSGAR